MLVNYYNYDEDVEVPFKIIVAREQRGNFLLEGNQNYIVNPSDALSIVKTKINQKQMILGLLVTTEDECRFHFAETSIGRSITSSDTEFMEHSRQYLSAFYQNMIDLGSVLEKAGAVMVDSREECDIDLSPETLEKDKIIQILTDK